MARLTSHAPLNHRPGDCAGHGTRRMRRRRLTLSGLSKSRATRSGSRRPHPRRMSALKQADAEGYGLRGHSISVVPA